MAPREELLGSGAELERRDQLRQRIGFLSRESRPIKPDGVLVDHFDCTSLS